MTENVDTKQFRELVMEGKWEEVIPLYEKSSKYHRMKVNRADNNAMHMAVNEGNEGVVERLVDAIVRHEEDKHVGSGGSALRLTNEEGNSPLHTAAWRGYTGICLAILINHCYPALRSRENNDGITPLEVLATRTSAFKSRSKLSWWRQILYYCIFVEPLNPRKELDLYSKKYGTPESTEDNEKDERHISICFSSPRLRTCVVSEKFEDNDALESALAFLTLGLSKLWGNLQHAEGTTSSSQIPQEHNKKESASKSEEKGTTSSSQMPQEHNKKESASKSEEKETTLVAVAKTGIVEVTNMDELKTKIPSDPNDFNYTKEGLLLVAVTNNKSESAKKIDKNETAYLAAAKNGIVEIVLELRKHIPSVVHDNTSNMENVLFVAVKNRQPHIVHKLQNSLPPKLFRSLISGSDNMDNTVLHLAAAGAVGDNEKTWQIPGAAMQMMWDIKWYQYIEGLVPDHFAFRNNKDGKIAVEIFLEQHKKLVEEGSEWLKGTSESCSVVAALIAGVSFATASTVPGGTDDGKPALEGESAFDVFTIASLIGLFFSVTALIMFLSILTSRKQAADFHRSLPFKLLFALTSLFASIASMLVSFCAAHFFVINEKFKRIFFPIYVATCLPVTFYAVVQFPLYADLVKAIFKKVPQTSGKGIHL
ncbi:uncharacterized protein LOC113854250 [Abrus precatorius]|uniref:Uncharacterized protein LOC113854250 n=1 Tax=Abrus precatorius TaxID=3816 RepID=A0A8B8KD12_ABRPR|nr:uncharacterized protein LOC113854250 [Abrus precatorius]